MSHHLDSPISARPRCSALQRGMVDRSTDNSPDVMFSLAANTPVSHGLGKDSVTSKPRQTFSYVPAEPETILKFISVSQVSSCPYLKVLQLHFWA